LARNRSGTTVMGTAIDALSVRCPTGCADIVVIKAAFESVPVADEATVAVTVIVAVEAGANEPMVQVSEVPDGAAHDPIELVAEAPETAAGSVSTTATAAAVEGPLFVASISHVTG
jgi:hypothetical protein